MVLPYSGMRFRTGRTGALRGTVACPLLLRAFPLALGPRAGEDTLAIALDQPGLGSTDIVHPLFGADGALTPHFAAKADFLWLFAATRRATLALAEALQNAGALIPWEIYLRFDDGEVVSTPSLLTVDPHFTDTSDYLALIARFGNSIVNLVEAVLLSRSHFNYHSNDQKKAAV